MPLDRRITITQYVSEPRDEHGETDRVIVATYRVYATVYPKSQLQQALELGQVTSRNRNYRIRYIRALDVVRPSLLTVDAGEIDEVIEGSFEPLIYFCSNKYEDTGRNGDIRRRWMVLECTYFR